MHPLPWGGLQGRKAPRRLPSKAHWPRSGPRCPLCGPDPDVGGGFMVPSSQSWVHSRAHTHAHGPADPCFSPILKPHRRACPPHTPPPEATEKRSHSGWVGLRVGSASLTYLLSFHLARALSWESCDFKLKFDFAPARTSR